MYNCGGRFRTKKNIFLSAKIYITCDENTSDEIVLLRQKKKKKKTGRRTVNVRMGWWRGGVKGERKNTRTQRRREWVFRLTCSTIRCDNATFPRRRRRTVNVKIFLSLLLFVCAYVVKAYTHLSFSRGDAQWHYTFVRALYWDSTTNASFSQTSYTFWRVVCFASGRSPSIVSAVTMRVSFVREKKLNKVDAHAREERNVGIEYFNKTSRAGSIVAERVTAVQFVSVRYFCRLTFERASKEKRK